jgi:tetratricopeptide (TPR) repeat protein
MVKGFARKHIKDGAADMADQKPAIVVSKGSRPSLFRKPSLRSTRVGLVAIGIIIIGLGIFAYWRHQTNQNRVVITHIPTAVEYQTAVAQKLKNNPPAVTATVSERLAYYDKLRKAEDLAGDNKGAISAFNSRLTISTEGLQFSDYYRLAQLYQAVGNKAAALKALDSAEKVIPADNPDAGYYRSDAVAAITRLRQELQ